MVTMNHHKKLNQAYAENVFLSTKRSRMVVINARFIAADGAKNHILATAPKKENQK